MENSKFVPSDLRTNIAGRIIERTAGLLGYIPGIVGLGYTIAFPSEKLLNVNIEPVSAFAITALAGGLMMIAGRRLQFRRISS